MCQSYHYSKKIVLAMLLTCFIGISACGSSNDNAPVDDDPGPNTGNIITVDNHIELLKYVFDILTGDVYVADMIVARQSG